MQFCAMKLRELANMAGTSEKKQLFFLKEKSGVEWIWDMFNMITS